MNPSFLVSLCTLLTAIGANADADIVAYSEENWKGEKFVVDGLNEPGDCKEFWNIVGGLAKINPTDAKWNDKTSSIKLGPGVCVRLYEHDCDWQLKGRILDVTPDSPFANDLGKMGFSGIVSGIELIDCPFPDPLVTVYDAENFEGNSLAIPSLRDIGDCEEFWNPLGLGIKISEELRRFNDKTVSVKLEPDTCVRLNADECEAPKRIVDVKPTSKWATDLADGPNFRGLASSIELIECPIPSGIILYSENSFQGDSVELDDLLQEDDLVKLWDPSGYQEPISDHYRLFNDRANSVKLPPGTCVRLYESTERVGRSLEVCDTDSFAEDLGSKDFSNNVSQVERIKPREIKVQSPPPAQRPRPRKPNIGTRVVSLR